MLIAYQGTSNDKALGATSDIHAGEWVRLEAPTDAEVEEVAGKLSLDAGLIRDALDPYEAPRFEIENGTAYIFLRYPFNEDPPGTAPLLIVVTESAVVTVALGTPSFLDKFADGRIHFFTTERTKLLILIINEISARYTAAMITIQRSVNRRTQRIAQMTVETITELAVSEAAVNAFLDALIPQANVLAKLAVGKTLPISEDDRELINDATLSTSQLIELGKSTLKTMENIREAHTAISTQQLNRVIRRLTALTVLVTVPNIVTGFYGMNILLPGAEVPVVAWYIIVGISIVVFAIVAFFIRKGWL